MSKTTVLACRVKPEIRATLDQQASVAGCRTSQLVVQIINDWLVTRTEPPAPVVVADDLAVPISC